MYKKMFNYITAGMIPILGIFFNKKLGSGKTYVEKEKNLDKIEKIIEKNGVDKIDWGIFSSEDFETTLSLDFIEKYKDHLDLKRIPLYKYEYNNLVTNEKFLEQFKDKIEWKYISARYLTPELIEKYKEYINFNENGMSYFTERFTNEKEADVFLEKYKDKIDSFRFTQWASEELLRKNVDKIDFDRIGFRKISDEFIEDFQDKIVWESFWCFNETPEKYVEKYLDKVEWKKLSKNSNLSEKIIEKYSDKVDWREISVHNLNLSNSFMEKNIDKLWLSEIPDYIHETFSENLKNKIIENKIEQKLLGKYKL